MGGGVQQSTGASRSFNYSNKVFVLSVLITAAKFGVPKLTFLQQEIKRRQ